MKIVEITTRVVTSVFAKPPRNPRSVWREKRALLVFIRTEDGRMGVGEAWCEGGSPLPLIALIEHDLVPLLLGADAREIAAHWERIYQLTFVSAKPGFTLAALAALDTALWDLAAQRAGEPLYRLLGGARDRVFTYASGGLYADDKGLDALGRELRGYVEQGFRAVKIKVAGVPLTEDIQRVAAVREAIGPETRLMVDAVYMLDVPGALRMARAFAPFDIHFLEAPLAPGNLPGLAQLARHSPLAIAGNEVAFGLDAYRDLIVQGHLQYVHLDVNQCGGVTEAMRIAALARAFHRPLSFHNATSAVAYAANLHVSAAIPNVDSIEWHMVHRMLFDSATSQQFRQEQGWALVPADAGLGLHIDPSVLAAV
ncbi:MAG: mandelate racemase/muconate lactonizing enzyme family protein [Casimicrobiaceae bacterium]